MSDNQLPKEQMLFNGQYLVIKKLGQGGFGIVCEAFDFSLKNFVAIKELLKEYAEVRFVEMFYKEALMAKNLIHDNIVRVQHFWKGDNGSYYIVMDYVVGRDLGHLLKKCSEKQMKLPWELSVFICGSMLKALDYANRLAKDVTTGKPYGIVYRDASPGNVMIFFDGNVKLSDFGIAKTAEELGRKSKQRIITGKYAYMSPEQIHGDSDIDHRSDIYSVGIVLYEMLSNSQLYNGTSDTIRKQITEGKIDLKPLEDMQVPQELVDIVLKALEKDKDKRYQTALEMFRDLRRLLKFKETEELSAELAAFTSKVMSEELEGEDTLLDWVRQINLQDVKSDKDVKRIYCRDFIMGDQSAPEQPAQPPVTSGDAEAPKDTVSLEVKSSDPAPAAPPVKVRVPERKKAPAPAAVAEHKVEERGKTVFEEVGDWLAKKFKVYKKRMLRISIAVAIAAVLFMAADTFMQITPLGKNIYAHLYPPDVVITTVPGGARVSLQTRDGKYILSNADSVYPVELRKVIPQSYVLTAEKEGYKPFERVIKIEEKGAGSKTAQRINIVFEFVLNINSDPSGADVFIDGNKFGVTPWKGDLVAGEHTVKLMLSGYENLGSEAKESHEGQCSLDFTRATDSEIFSGIDKVYWKYDITSESGVKTFNLAGALFKRYNITSSPNGASVYVNDEPQRRAMTPAVIPFKNGEYSLRLTDANGRYEETRRTLKVEKESDNT